MRKKEIVLCLCLLSLVYGCDALTGLIDIFQPRRTTVSFVNNSDFAVEVTVFFDDQQDIPEDVLTATGTERQFTIDAGATMTFSEDCDNLQAIIIDDADLRVIGGAGPQDSTDVLRDGDDFGCGDTIIFTFDHSEVIIDFNITVTTRGGS